MYVRSRTTLGLLVVNVPKSLFARSHLFFCIGCTNIHVMFTFEMPLYLESPIPDVDRQPKFTGWTAVLYKTNNWISADFRCNEERLTEYTRISEDLEHNPVVMYCINSNPADMVKMKACWKILVLTGCQTTTSNSLRNSESILSDEPLSFCWICPSMRYCLWSLTVST